MQRKPYVLILLIALLAATGSAGAVPLQQQPEAAAQLRVPVGKSLVINSEENLQRVSVTDAAIASAIIVAPKQVLIHGMTPGSITLILWDDQDRTRSFNLTVEVDVNTLSQTLAQVFPGENIRVGQTGGAVVLSGSVSSKDIGDRAVAFAASQSKSVVNLLVPTEGHQVIMLQVRFAEVDRAALSQLGMNIFSTGAANTPGAVSTQQFGALGGLNAKGTIPGELKGTSTTFNLADLLNVFVFRPDLNLGVTIRALQQQNVLQILAEPNVLALTGTEASFLAGGEFPIPIVQGTAGLSSVTIQFKEFGIRLNFTPTLLADGAIRLKVAPEVSALDFANAVTIGGFSVPALSTRRASTQVELRDGQSFAIAGLLDNRTTEIANKIPVLGDIPVLGNFFKSRATNKTNSELLVMVTPRLVQAISPSAAPAGPQFPKPFLDKEKFDGPVGETPQKRGANPPAEVIPQEARSVGAR